MIGDRFKNLILTDTQTSEGKEMFSASVEKSKENGEQSVGLEIKNVEKTDPDQFKSVNLEVEALIEDTPESEVKYTDIDFGNLKTGWSNVNQSSFGVSVVFPESMSMLPKPQQKVDLHINNEEVKSSRKINNWFSRLIEQKGEDYITSGRLTVEEVSRNAERIIDDMVSGRIDYDRFGKYLIMPVIIDTLINYCSNKLAINRALQFSLGYTYNDYTEKNYLYNDSARYATISNMDDALVRNISQSIAIVDQDIAIYGIIYDRLVYVNTTKNASSLYSLISELNNYKKQAKKRY